MGSLIRKASIADEQVAMFLLLMPVFAAPLEAFAALGEVSRS
jgi:hypothetical protein